MKDQQTIDAWLLKAQESLESAESEYANHCYNSCANRCYHACFKVASAALLAAGIGPRDPRGRWGHDYVEATFVGQMINRRKRYPRSVSDTLAYHFRLRQLADYSPKTVTQKKAERALRRTREFVQVILQKGESA